MSMSEMHSLAEVEAFSCCLSFSVLLSSSRFLPISESNRLY